MTYWSDLTDDSAGGMAPVSPGLLNSSNRTRFVNADSDCGIDPTTAQSCSAKRVSAVAPATSEGMDPSTACDDSTSACSAVNLETAAGIEPATAAPVTFRFLPTSKQANEQGELYKSLQEQPA